MMRAILLTFVLAIGCAPSTRPTAVLRLATTTSVRDCGLLDELIPEFEKRTGCRVDVIAVGSGAALQLGRQGDADVLFVHAPQAEKEFMDEGAGERHVPVMSNEFLLLGPDDDPAEARGADVMTAFERIARRQCRFLSRGDDSGTHMKERQIWHTAMIEPDWPDFIETGQGMGATLRMADEMQAYTLSDRATWLSFKSKLSVVPLNEPDEVLKNVYSVIVVEGSRDRSPLADRLVDYYLSPEVQTKIGDYRYHGEPLFDPIAEADRRWN